MSDTTTHPDTEEAREERAEAAQHRAKEAEHRKEAAEDRREADAHRAQGEHLRAAGDELEAKGHDLAAGVRDAAADHDEREAAAEAGTAHRDATAAHATATTQGTVGDDDESSLLGGEHRRRFRSRWDEVQSSFIDDPRSSVAEADKLVREATEALHDRFERDRRQLEGVWDRGDEVSTENLRVTLQRYRSFFERLLTI